MAHGSYRQFCPVAMAAETLCTRWTIVLLREMIAGSTRFNDLRRGVPRMSPALLSQRLKDLEQAGIVRRERSRKEPGVFEYRLTPAGLELKPLIEAFGVWGQRWIDSDVSLQNLDVQLLMWDMRRNLQPSPMPQRRSVLQFQYPELPASQRHWWLLVAPGEDIDLCAVDPGFDVDLYVTTDLRTMTSAWSTSATSDRTRLRSRPLPPNAASNAAMRAGLGVQSGSSSRPHGSSSRTLATPGALKRGVIGTWFGSGVISSAAASRGPLCSACSCRPRGRSAARPGWPRRGKEVQAVPHGGGAASLRPHPRRSPTEAAAPQTC